MIFRYRASSRAIAFRGGISVGKIFMNVGTLGARLEVPRVYYHIAWSSINQKAKVPRTSHTETAKPEALLVWLVGICKSSRYNSHFSQSISQHHTYSLLSALGGATSPQTNDTFLIACVLFFCFECLQGHYRAAFQHAIAGLRIIKQQQMPSSRSSSAMYMPPGTIAVLFATLESQMLEVEGEDSLALELQPTSLSFFADPIDGL